MDQFFEVGYEDIRLNIMMIKRFDALLASIHCSKKTQDIIEKINVAKRKFTEWQFSLYRICRDFSAFFRFTSSHHVFVRCGQK